MEAQKQRCVGGSTRKGSGIGMDRPYSPSVPELAHISKRAKSVNGRLTFSRPKHFASAAETMGGCSTTTGAGVAGA